jgi:hypothetical protein
MVIGTGKELVTFAERHGAIISQHIWEVLTDLDKCAPKSMVEQRADNSAMVPCSQFKIDDWCHADGDAMCGDKPCMLLSRHQ